MVIYNKGLSIGHAGVVKKSRYVTCNVLYFAIILFRFPCENSELDNSSFSILVVLFSRRPPIFHDNIWFLCSEDIFENVFYAMRQISKWILGNCIRNNEKFFMRQLRMNVDFEILHKSGKTYSKIFPISKEKKLFQCKTSYMYYINVFFFHIFSISFLRYSGAF